MARRKRLAVSKAGTAVASKASTSESMDLAQIWKALTKPRGKVKQKGMKPHEMTFLLSNLSTLVSNGVPLPKAIATMGQRGKPLKASSCPRDPATQGRIGPDV